MILKVIKFPNKILRAKAQSVKFPLNQKINTLVKDMLDTVRQQSGLGLAAPQIGQSLRIVVINLEHVGVPPFALINPEVTKLSKKETELEEGCLSIPGVFGWVSRPEKITFKAQTVKGETISVDADGLLAKVVQHEIDHLNGILILEKITRFTQGEELAKEMKL